MLKNKTLNIIFIILILSLPVFIYSCEKREPAAQPEPNEIMKKIIENFPENNITYESNNKSKELKDKAANDIYSDDKNNSVDLSKIEKYSIIKADKNSAVEIGIFKLYDKINAEYVRNMAQTRISKMQNLKSEPKNIDISNIINDAEIRSYGNYVYYVSHPQKDKIFKIIENTLRGA